MTNGKKQIERSVKTESSSGMTVKLRWLIVRKSENEWTLMRAPLHSIAAAAVAAIANLLARPQHSRQLCPFLFRNSVLLFSFIFHSIRFLSCACLLFFVLFV